MKRAWADGDTVKIALPMALSGEKYVGRSGVPGFERYFFSYGVRDRSSSLCVKSIIFIQMVAGRGPSVEVEIDQFSSVDG